MSINQIYTQQAATITPNPKPVKQHDEAVTADNTPRETGGNKLNMALKCLGAAAIAGLAIYGGAKGLKYLKGKKAANFPATTLPVLKNTPKSNEMLFKGMSAADIIKEYKAGNKRIYKELAKLAHPDGKNYDAALFDLFNTVRAGIR